MTSLEHRRRSRPHLDLDRTPGRHRWDEAGSLGSRARRVGTRRRARRVPSGVALSVVLFLAGERRRFPAASALDAALRESLAGLAQGALVGLVLAPARGGDGVALRDRPACLGGARRAGAGAHAGAGYGQDREGSRRRARLSCPPDATRTTRSRDSNSAAHEACEARQTAARRALQAWMHPAVAIALGGRGSPPSPAPSPRGGARGGAPARGDGVRVRGGGDGAASARRWSRGGERARGDGGARARISRRTAQGHVPVPLARRRLRGTRGEEPDVRGQGFNQRRRRRSRGRERSLARCASVRRDPRSSWTPRMGGPPPRCLPRRRSGERTAAAAAAAAPPLVPGEARVRPVWRGRRGPSALARRRLPRLRGRVRLLRRGRGRRRRFLCGRPVRRLRDGERLFRVSGKGKGGPSGGVRVPARRRIRPEISTRTSCGRCGARRQPPSRSARRTRRTCATSWRVGGPPRRRHLVYLDHCGAVAQASSKSGTSSPGTPSPARRRRRRDVQHQG